MFDNFREKNSPATSAPAEGGEVPSNDTDFAQISRAIYVGTTGNLSVKMKSGATLTFKTVPAGVIIPVRAVRVVSATNTATVGDLIVLY